ncbi:MAG: FAD binding domain-containing protein [Christensenellales bacterium]
MIPFNFIYCCVESLSEASLAFTQLADAGHNPYYYSGGTEIITMSRAGSIRPGAVIDIKSIPECNVLEFDCGMLVIGAACTLNKMKESRLFPLLGTAAGRIADHTNQCRITLGGNLCGSIIYRETSLPLMVSDAEIMLYGPSGSRIIPFHSVFRQRMLLANGEFIVQVRIPVPVLQLPYSHIKRTTNEKIDYPLVNVTILQQGGRLRAAFSGLCPYPFRSLEIEDILNDKSVSRQARIDRVSSLLPEPALADTEGSGGYRLFVLKNTLLQVLEEWENGMV